MLLQRTEIFMALRNEARKATVDIDTISCLGSSQLLEWPELCPLNWTPWSYPAIGLTDIEAVGGGGGGITYTCNFLHLSTISSPYISLIRQQQQQVMFQGAHHVLCTGDAQPVLFQSGEYLLHDAPFLRRFVDMH